MSRDWFVTIRSLAVETEGEVESVGIPQSDAISSFLN